MGNKLCVEAGLGRNTISQNASFNSSSTTSPPYRLDLQLPFGGNYASPEPSMPIIVKPVCQFRVGMTWSSLPELKGGE